MEQQTFQFPSSYQDLIEGSYPNRDTYQVSAKNMAKGMDDRMKQYTLKQFTDSFTNDKLSLMEDSNFDLLYYFIGELRQKFDQVKYIQILDILAYQIQLLLRTFLAGQQIVFHHLDSNDHEALKRNLFLLLNTLITGQKKTQQINQASIPLKNSNILNVSVRKALNAINLIHSHASVVLNKEASHYFFNLIQLIVDFKEQDIKDLVFSILIKSIKKWNQELQNIKTLIINILYENENISVSLSQFFAQIYKDEGQFGKQILQDILSLLINYISQNQSKQAHIENQAAKNLKELLGLLSKLIPKFFYSNLSNFMHLYDSENYYFRNGLTEILTNVLEFTIKNQNELEDYSEKSSNLFRIKLIETLLGKIVHQQYLKVRQNDKIAFARSLLLNQFTYLLKNNLIPVESMEQVFDMCMKRISDISAWVRKAAIITLKQITKFSKYKNNIIFSQNCNDFFSINETQIKFQLIEEKLSKIENEFTNLKTEYELKEEFGSHQNDFQDRIQLIKIQSENLQQSKSCLEQYQYFLKRIDKGLNQIISLLGSKNNGDVIASIKLISYICRYKLEGYERAQSKMIGLIWHNEKSIKLEALKQFCHMHINDEQTLDQILKKLMGLYMNADIKTEASLNQIMKTLIIGDMQYEMPKKFFKLLWNRLVCYLDYQQDQFLALLKIFSIHIQTKLEYMDIAKIAFLSQYLGRFQKRFSTLVDKYQPQEWQILKEIFLIFQFTQDRSVYDVIKNALHLIYKNFGCRDTQWYSVCQEIVNLISTTQNADKYFQFLIRQLSERIVKKVEQDNQRYYLYIGNIQISQQNAFQEMEIETEVINESILENQQAQLIFLVGHISIKILTNVDSLISQVKQIQKYEERINQCNKEEHNELDKISGGNEAELFHKIEFLTNITEKRIIQQNLLSQFLPIIQENVKNILSEDQTIRNIKQNDERKAQNNVIDKVSILSLCKFMCVSQEFCKENISILFELLKCQNVDQGIKNNIIISLGDLLHRFPSTIQQYHKQIYANLYDGDSSVRRITLLVLTHLILNDMIKSKSSLSHIPRLLNDPDPCIPQMARYFLQELQKKDSRCILNSFTDILTNLRENSETIIPQIIQYIEKSQQDNLAERLLQRLGEKHELQETRSISLCLSLLSLQQNSFKRILDGWELIREKMEDPFVQDQFTSLVRKKHKRTNQNQEFKELIEELEFKIQNFNSETFESKRRLPDRARKSKTQQQERKEQPLEITKKERKESHEVQKKQLPQRIKQRITKSKKVKDEFIASESDDDDLSGYDMDYESPVQQQRKIRQQKRLQVDD